MKKAIIFIFLCFLLYPCRMFSQSDSIVIWSEDFTGYPYNFFPTCGKNAEYKSGNAKPSIEYPSSIGKAAPDLLIPESGHFDVSVSLNGASGQFVLTFKVNNPNNIKVTSDKGVSISGSRAHYTITVPSNVEKLNLHFTANKKNVRIDDVFLLAPSNCRQNKKTPSLSFSSDSVVAFLGEDVIPPHLVNPSDVPVSYWSSDQSVATVNAEGNISLKSLGSAIISAIFSGNDEYGYEETSYVLHVSRRVPDDEIFYEDFDDVLSRGGNDGDFSKSSGYIADRNKYLHAPHAGFKCIEIISWESQDTSFYTIGPFSTLAAGNGYVSFKAAGGNGSDGKGFLVLSENGKEVKTDEFEVKMKQWSTITIPFTDADANTTFIIKGSYIFLDSISVRALPKQVEVKVGSAGYASMYYGNYALKVPNGVDAYTMKVVDNKIVDSRWYAQGDTIPKATAVIVRAEQGTYGFEVTGEGGFVDDANQLRGTDYKMLTSGGNLYYMLAAPKGRKVGYYWGAQKGAAFMNGKHKAYLALTKPVSAKSGYAFDSENLPTAVEKAWKGGISSDNHFFNLLGQRIKDNKFSYKGLIVTKGKKFIKR